MVHLAFNKALQQSRCEGVEEFEQKAGGWPFAGTFKGDCAAQTKPPTSTMSNCHYGPPGTFF